MVRVRKQSTAPEHRCVQLGRTGSTTPPPPPFSPPSSERGKGGGGCASSPHLGRGPFFFLFFLSYATIFLTTLAGKLSPSWSFTVPAAFCLFLSVRSSLFLGFQFTFSRRGGVPPVTVEPDAVGSSRSQSFSLANWNSIISSNLAEERNNIGGVSKFSGFKNLGTLIELLFLHRGRSVSVMSVLVCSCNERKQKRGNEEKKRIWSVRLTPLPWKFKS